MPKLRKHSNLNQRHPQEQQNEESNSYNLESKVQQSNSLLDKPLVGRKMKYSQVSHRLKEFDKRMKNCSQNSSSIIIRPCESNDKVQMETYFNKFTDDDKECSKESIVIATKAKGKKGIRVSNKFFSSCEFDEGEKVEKQLQQDELVVQKRQLKNADHLLNKVQRKAENFKNRLQFKNLEQDVRFKQSMKDKLKSIEGCSQVQLLIEVPKVTGKGLHADAAIFLKNVKPSFESSLVPQEEQYEQLPKDRKSFYEGLVKKMKIKRSQSITQSILKQNFKKSKLDQNDFLLDLGQKENSNVHDRNSNSAYQTCVKGPQQAYLIEQKQQEQIKQPQPQQEKSRQSQISSNQIKVDQSQNVNKKDDQTQVSQSPLINKIKPKKAKQSRKKRKGKKINIKDLIEEQAEDSDDGCSNLKKEENQDSQQNQDEISSLIDDSITLCEQDEELAHRKFIKDMMEQQQRKFAMMQKKMFEQGMEEEERLRKRMEAASKRNRQKDEKQLVFKVQEEKRSQPSEDSISNAKNMQKLKQLQIDLGLKKPVSSQSNPISDQPTIIKNMSSIEKLLEIEIADIRKPIRNGLKNVGLKPKQTKKLK